MNAGANNSVITRNPDYNYGIMKEKTQKIIIKFGTRTAVINIKPQIELNQCGDYKTYVTQQTALMVFKKWGLCDDEYYLDIPTNITNGRCDLFVDVQPRIRGGNLFTSFFRGVINGIMSIFKPIVKPLAGIANAFLMLVKGVLYIIMLFMWFLKLCVWFFTEVLPSIPTDIFGMVRFLASMLIDAVVGTIGYYFKKIFNTAGSTVVGAALSGWDNNPDEDDTTPTKSQKSQTVSEFEDSEKSQFEDSEKSQFEDSEKSQFEDSEKTNQPSCEGRKCYRTEAGTVPWTVILATVLFPPAGVFMELGLHGFIQILVCLLLTFMFYFPGLIYALILLYC